MSNIIDSIQLSGTTYQIQGSGGNNVVELTQAEYDALVDKDPTAFYIITDAEAGDLTQYWTSAQTQSAITSAVSTKQDQLVSGTNIKTINNESLLGSGNIDIQGGGKAIEGGRGITVTTGETADTVSFNLPISAGTGTNSVRENGWNSNTVASGNYSHAEGYGTEATNQSSHAEGHGTEAKGKQSHTEGASTIANNDSEHASGQWNVSSKASTTFGNSGNTLFSVGNGTSNARHNAFEIRQNGDIYLNDGTNDVKLQDTITATAANTTALGGLKLVKLTQSEYDSLSTYDSNTLYVIVN